MAAGCTGNSDFPQGVWHNLYIHLPFCASKCGYCAFYSRTACSLELRTRYLTAVRDFIKKCCFPEDIKTVYLGGGTPNFLTADELSELFEFVRNNVPLSSDCEISCELNPECMTESKLSVLNEYVTRISLGVQSFDAAVRQKLMRRCSNEHLFKALKLLEKRKAQHFNIDLIYAVAQVPWKVFENDLHQALAQGVDHLSCYALTPEENSILGLDSPAADDADGAEWWHRIEQYLSAGGVYRYEISNYARPGCECQHNMNVWNGDTLLGAGASAAGFNGVDRYTFESDIESFIDARSFQIDRTGSVLRMLEIFAVKLRTTEGWYAEQWQKLYPGSWDKIKQLCLKTAGKNPLWWQINDKQIKLSADGMLFWDDAAMAVLEWSEELEK